MNAEEPESERRRKLGADYASALQQYTAEGGEKWLNDAHELGRRAMGIGLGILDLVTMHGDASGPEPSARGNDFLREALAQFEITHRGFAEANASLRKLTESLQQQVDERTEALRERQRLSEALNEINTLMRSSLDAEQITSAVLAKGAETIGADSGSVAVAEGTDWVVRYVWHHDPNMVGRRFTNERNRWTALAVEQGRAVVADESCGDSLDAICALAGTGTASTIVAPIVVRGRTIAVLHFNHGPQPHEFTPVERDFIEKLTSSLSLALDNVLAYEAEHDIADRLQEALLSLPDTLPGIEFAHAYHSATEAARVGGDFYDVFELSHGHIGITIGDVAGKGLDAAVLTSLVKNTIRAHASEKGKTPAQILTLTNEVVYRSTTTEAFVTVFFAILDCRDGRLVYGNAGHTTAALVRNGGKVVKMASTGSLLGAFAGAEFAQSEVRLEPDALLFLYTDGLTEARVNTEQYGEERLFAFLSSATDLSTEDVVAEAIADVLSFAGGRLRDDLAILAVRRLESGAETPTQQKLEM